MEKELRNINKCFENNFVPHQFNYKKPPCINSVLDWDKIMYNAFYRSYEYTENKFPTGYENIPAFDKVIEMCMSDKTPLDEMNSKCAQQEQNKPEFEKFFNAEKDSDTESEILSDTSEYSDVEIL